MSEINTSEDKNIVIGIQNSLRNNTKYMYHSGVEFKASNDVKEIRPENLEFKVVQGFFNISDYFILMEVHRLGIANPATVLKRLAVEKRRNPDKAYPEYDIRALKTRMQFLVRQGLLYSYEYRDSYDRTLFVFICTMYGWRVYKNKLQSPDVYDKNMAFKADSEMFKRLASNAVAYSFALNPNCNSVLVNEYVTYTEGKWCFVYGMASLGEEDTKTKYLIEPVYYEVDKRTTSEAENETQISYRLGQLENMVEVLNKTTPTKLVICVENYNGLLKLLEELKRRDMSFYKNNCYVTSENVLFDSKDDLTRSFLKFGISKGQYTLSLVKDF